MDIIELEILLWGVQHYNSTNIITNGRHCIYIECVLGRSNIWIGNSSRIDVLTISPVLTSVKKFIVYHVSDNYIM